MKIEKKSNTKDNQITNLKLFVFFFIFSIIVVFLGATKSFVEGSVAIKKIAEGGYVFYRNGAPASWGVFVKSIFLCIGLAFLGGLFCTFMVNYFSRSEKVNGKE